MAARQLKSSLPHRNLGSRPWVSASPGSASPASSARSTLREVRAHCDPGAARITLQTFTWPPETDKGKARCWGLFQTPAQCSTSSRAGSSLVAEGGHVALVPPAGSLHLHHSVPSLLHLPLLAPKAPVKAVGGPRARQLAAAGGAISMLHCTQNSQRGAPNLNLTPGLTSKFMFVTMPAFHGFMHRQWPTCQHDVAL